MLKISGDWNIRKLVSLDGLDGPFVSGFPGVPCEIRKLLVCHEYRVLFFVILGPCVSSRFNVCYEFDGLNPLLLANMDHDPRLVIRVRVWRDGELWARYCNQDGTLARGSGQILLGELR